MAQFSLHAYDADVWVPQFMGLNQADDGMNQDIRFASEEKNVETVGGVLQPRAPYTILNHNSDPFAGAPIETLTWFYRRWFTGEGSKGWFVAASGGHLYASQTGVSDEWLQITMPQDLESFQSNVWSWVTYEINPEGAEHSIDVLIMTNPLDGMIMISPPDRPYAWSSVATHNWGYYSTKTWGELMSNEWVIEQIEIAPLDEDEEEDIKFGILTRSNERIWGGAIPGHPDRLIYSAPYNPTDWTQNNEHPEDGAGEILQPSWDGDSFTALRQFGDQLLAFKQHRVWRVLGTNPGEYTFKEQYGGGTGYPNTIAVDIEKVFMVDNDGPSVFDGMSVSPYAREQIRHLWQTVNKSALDQMCAALYQQRYYLALPVDGSTVNNALLIYNMREGTILFHKDIYIESLLSTSDGLFATSSTIPGKVMKLGYDSWQEGQASGAATRWVSPWIDFGYKRIQKGGFDLYITPEVQKDPVTIKFSIQTEKKTKTKEYTVTPLTAAQIAANKEYRYKKLHFGGTGRKFRIIIETEEGSTAPWRLVGGLHLVVETDPD